jgi:hypothetical protein
MLVAGELCRADPAMGQDVGASKSLTGSPSEEPVIEEILQKAREPNAHITAHNPRAVHRSGKARPALHRRRYRSLCTWRPPSARPSSAFTALPTRCATARLPPMTLPSPTCGPINHTRRGENPDVSARNFRG